MTVTARALERFPVDAAPTDRRNRADEPRILLPIAGPLEPNVLEVAIRLAEVKHGAFVAAYLTVVPLQYNVDAPEDVSWAAAPLLDEVEQAALDVGVRVTTRIGTGRTLTHALARLWANEHFTRIVAVAPSPGKLGFSESDLAWLLAHAPAPTLVVKPPAKVTADRTEGNGRGFRLSADSTRLPVRTFVPVGAPA
jgi:hypothetical protein